MKNRKNDRLIHIPAAVTVVLLVFFIFSCSPKPPPKRPAGHPKPYRVGSTWYQPISSAHDFKQTGIASWYGKKFHGRKTSNGEIYNMYGMSAAHKTLPLGTWVRVHNKNNGKEIDVRINDRGPFIQGRIIDLSYTAANRLGMVDEGTAPVEIVALGNRSKNSRHPETTAAYTPIDVDAGNFTFQVGAFKNRDNALRLKQKLGRSYRNAHITTWNNGEDIFYRVRVGKYTSLKKITEDEAVMIKNGFRDVIIVAE
jgi:rare lipoprotein A